MKRPDAPPPLSLIEAIIPVACLIALVGLLYLLFGDAGTWALSGTLVAMVYFNSLRKRAHEQT